MSTMVDTLSDEAVRVTLRHVELGSTERRAWEALGNARAASTCRAVWCR